MEYLDSGSRDPAHSLANWFQDSLDKRVAEPRLQTGFFRSLKMEAIQYEPLMNRSQMRQAVFEYIEVDYNRRRRHSALGYLSPEQYEKRNVA